jgi:arylsulfatase A-like enzyme
MPLLFKGMRAGTPTDTEGYRAWLGHGFHVYETLVHVPLLVRAPGVLPNGKVEAMTSHVDLLSTLASALELDGSLPPHVSGLDLTDLVRNGGGPTRDALYVQASGARRMNRPEQWLAGLRTDRYKYARGMHNADLPEELYDLASDPDERVNLAAQRSDVTADMRARLTAVMQADDAAEPAADTAYTAEEEALLEARLRELGYLD